MAADWGSSSYRKQLFSGYKQNREELRAEQTQKEKDDFELFFAEYERTLDVMEKEGHLVLKFRRVEADDIAAYIVKYKKNFKINKIWLASSDRDWDLLVSDNVSRFSYVTRKETTVDNWREHYDFPREEYITFKCLTGDKGDNIPGIYGIGPKRATKVMETYGSVFDIYSSCPINEKYKYIQELNANAEQLLTNVELMDLITYCDEAIGYENCLELRDKLGDYI
jgi:5'-3' exonuclease